jgi:hypothetical protein
VVMDLQEVLPVAALAVVLPSTPRIRTPSPALGHRCFSCTYSRSLSTWYNLRSRIF